MADQHSSDDRLANEQLAGEQHTDEHRAGEHANDRQAEDQPAEQDAANEHRADNDRAASERPADDRPTPSHEETPVPVWRERYEIAPDYDLLLIVKVDWAPNCELVYEFEASRKILAGIPYFRRLLYPESRDGGQQLVGKEVIELKHDDPKAWKTWLQILHSRLERSSYEVETVTVWHMLAIAEKYGINPAWQSARDWFNQWLCTQSGEGLFTDRRRICEVLFPCHTFDHALGFSAGTMWLAYNSVGHIKEIRPAPFDKLTHLSLPHGIMQQVNAARGRLKTILHRELYESVDELLEEVRCPLRETVLWRYFAALNKTRSWPLERYMSKESINGLLHNLEYFEYNDPHPHGTCNWPKCGCNFKRVVENAIDETAQLFNGLCLDCMNGTSATNADKGSWKHYEKHHDWSEGCRIAHEEPTYYYSTIMRRRDM